MHNDYHEQGNMNMFVMMRRLCVMSMLMIQKMDQLQYMSNIIVLFVVLSHSPSPTIYFHEGCMVAAADHVVGMSSEDGENL